MLDAEFRYPRLRSGKRGVPDRPQRIVHCYLMAVNALREVKALVCQTSTMESLSILLRESVYGRLINNVSKGRFLSYNVCQTVKFENILTPDPQGRIIVGFVGPDDPGIPHNWPTLARMIAGLNVMLLNFSFYAASAMFTPSIPGIEEAFGATTAEGTLGLSLFVIAYGIGPLIVCLHFHRTTGIHTVLSMNVSSFPLYQAYPHSDVRRYISLAALLSACSTLERLWPTICKPF